MFATYDRSGICFAFPESWTLEEDSDPEARVHLTLSSPETGFWTLILYPELIDLPHVLDQAVEALRGEYDDLEVATTEETIAGQLLAGRDANFFCFDLTSTARLRACHRGGSTYLILCQAEDRELSQVEPVFAAITQSLLSNDPLPNAAE